MSFSLVINFFSYLLLTWETCVLSCFSCVWLFMTLWTVAHQAPLFMGFSRQEYWSGLPFPSPGDLPDPGIEPGSPALEADALTSEPPGKPMALIPGLGRSPGRGNDNPFQWDYLENPMNRGAWQATVHRVMKSQTRLKWLGMHTHKVTLSTGNWLSLSKFSEHTGSNQVSEMVQGPNISQQIHTC